MSTAPVAVFDPVELPSHYGKAIVAILTATVVAVIAALTDNFVSVVEVAQIAVAVTAAVGVYLVPNLPSGVGRYAKALVAMGGAGLQALTTVLMDGSFTTQGALVVLLAVLGSVSVGIIPNTGSLTNTD